MAQRPDVLREGKSEFLKSYLCVPLKTSTQTLGTLTLGYAESGRTYSQRELALAEDLGRRAAIAMDNARLREEADRLLDAERAARTEAERAGRLKDEFLATLSHELRTPLNAILGWTHILSSGGLEPEEMEQGLETIDRNARAQARIIEDLLDMSKIMQGKIHLDVQDIDLVKITEAAVQAVQPSCKVKKITIQCSLPPAAPTRGDAIRLQQVVWNLLSNAIKFSLVEGRIEVKLTLEDEQLVLAVRDYGAGIKPEFLPHLFEKFRQQDGTITRGVGGMGLGLSIARQILEFHGGSVRAHSEGKDTGSLFMVRLPMVSNAETETARKQVRVKLTGLKILVVEDDSDAREFLVRLLKDRGAVVVSAASADQALALLEQQTPDLLISDIGMPNKDGYQLIREVRAQSAWAALPAIAVTAFARREDKEAALASGYQRHITKPIDASRLLEAACGLTRREPPGD
ncbi:MAG: response regulator [Candidatus Eremiobacteraeota bacterium]|nr:response regulator [Candidatus Eremiobacteraeota bacterium]